MRGIALIGTGAVCLFAVAAFAQSNLAQEQDVSGPRAVFEQFRSLNARSALNDPEARALLAGGLTRLSRASLGDLPESDRIIVLTDGSAVLRLPAQSDTAPDGYLYLVRGSDSRWRISAYRALALMGVPTELRRLLRAAPSLDAEQQWTLANLELTLASDARLRAWFGEHRAALENLRRIALAARPAAADSEVPVASEAARTAVRAAHALGLNVSGRGVVRLTLGGILDNEVGLLHAPTPADAPPISPDAYIWVEPLGDGWYLYKTT